jgi:hypothetical protein
MRQAVTGDTLPMPNAPLVPGRVRTPRPVEGKRTTTRPIDAASGSPAWVEVECVDQSGLEMQQSDSCPLFEIWTRNRVYHIDTALVCIAVVTRATGAVEGTHPLRGARLTGGERRHKDSHHLEVYFPLPAPGSEGVFRTDVGTQPGRFTKTSVIERVVLRLRRVRIAAAQGQPWDALVGRPRR